MGYCIFRGATPNALQEEAMVLDMIATKDINEISAGRFVLRPVRKSDAGLFAMYAGDRRVAEATHSIPHPLPPGAAEAFVDRAMTVRADEDVWVMDGTATGLAEVLGVINLKRMDQGARGGVAGQSEISYWVAPAYWKTGIASEAVQAIIKANPQHCRTIFAEVFQDNAGSARVLTNAGFEYLGDAETFSVARGARVPTWTYIRKLD
jgi:RimJ/RimL family protein N-acetyltransferase